MFSLQPLGDQAVIAYLDSEAEAQALAYALRAADGNWLVDVVPAYASVAVFYDLAKVDYREVSQRLSSLMREEWRVESGARGAPVSTLHSIPCCYEMGPDLARVADHRGLALEEVVRLHTGTIYTVYAIGFCPGFPYLGYLPKDLTGVPRLLSPRVRVEPGSVGLTGRQTGIYPEARPGGWNLIGRTPLELVNIADGYFPLRTGDRVHFKRIDEAEFGKLRGQRL